MVKDCPGQARTTTPPPGPPQHQSAINPDRLTLTAMPFRTFALLFLPYSTRLLPNANFQSQPRARCIHQHPTILAARPIAHLDSSDPLGNLAHRPAGSHCSANGGCIANSTCTALVSGSEPQARLSFELMQPLPFFWTDGNSFSVDDANGSG
ncbi:MAG: hypothetical protein Q9203_004042 [Teloschistes exilis]